MIVYVLSMAAQAAISAWKPHMWKRIWNDPAYLGDQRQ